MEHLEHFSLGQDPFRNDPQLAFYFASPQHSDAERRLLRGVRQGKGLSVIVGDSGCGKTMLVHHLLDGLDEERFEASLIVMVHAGCDSEWLLQCIGRSLGVATPAPTRVELLGQLYEQLIALQEEGRRPVVVIDEAQMLTRPETLTELRGLLNLEHDERRLLSVVLSGLPELDQLLKQDPPLAERIDIRVELARLDEATAAAYLSHRITTAGGDAAILEPATAATIARISGGIPRRINTLADNALFEAYVAGRERVVPEDVERAALDLPWARSAVALAAPDAAPDRLPEPSSVAPLAAAPLPVATAAPAAAPVASPPDEAPSPPVPAPAMHSAPAVPTEPEAPEASSESAEPRLPPLPPPVDLPDAQAPVEVASAPEPVTPPALEPEFEAPSPVSPTTEWAEVVPAFARSSASPGGALRSEPEVAEPVAEPELPPFVAEPEAEPLPPEPPIAEPLAEPELPPFVAEPEAEPFPPEPPAGAPRFDADATAPGAFEADDLSSVSAQVEAVLWEEPEPNAPVASPPSSVEPDPQAQTVFLADDVATGVAPPGSPVFADEKPEDEFSDDSLDNLFVNLVEQD